MVSVTEVENQTATVPSPEMDGRRVIKVRTPRPLMPTSASFSRGSIVVNRKRRRPSPATHESSAFRHFASFCSVQRFQSGDRNKITSPIANSTSKLKCCLRDSGDRVSSHDGILVAKQINLAIIVGNTMQPFHLAVPSCDGYVRQFYKEVIGCTRGLIPLG